MNARPARARVVVTALGTAQTLAWASSYYLPAILADPIGASIGVPRSWVFGAFSGALLIAAFAGPAVGRVIDRHGGRGVLVLSNIVLAAGLIALAAANGVVGLFAAWAILGVGMALGLYDAGFAALAALYGHNARGPITGITLFAGFASTVSWPLSTFLNDALGWRETVLVWAALNLVIGLPLNRAVAAAGTAGAAVALARGPSIGWKPYKEMFLLAFVFAAAWFVTGAMASQLPRCSNAPARRRCRRSPLPRLVGPAQVAARLVEFLLLRRISSAGLGADRSVAASDRRRRLRRHRRAGGGRVRCFLRRRQRPSDHRARHRAARGVRPARLWRTHRPAWRAGARGAGFRAAAVRPVARRHGSVGHFVSVALCLAALAALLCLRAPIGAGRR